MTADYLAMMQAHVDEGGQLNHRNGVDLLAEITRLRAELAARIPPEATEAMLSVEISPVLVIGRHDNHRVKEWREATKKEMTARMARAIAAAIRALDTKEGT